jgi:hypothetical protein
MITSADFIWEVEACRRVGVSAYNRSTRRLARSQNGTIDRARAAGMEDVYPKAIAAGSHSIDRTTWQGCSPGKGVGDTPKRKSPQANLYRLQCFKPRDQNGDRQNPCRNGVPYDRWRNRRRSAKAGEKGPTVTQHAISRATGRKDARSRVCRFRTNRR